MKIDNKSFKVKKGTWIIKRRKWVIKEKTGLEEESLEEITGLFHKEENMGKVNKESFVVVYYQFYT